MQYCCSIMMVTDAVEIIYSGWSWWWRGSNRSDELARMALTLSFAVFVITWYMLVTRNLRGARPPLPPGPRGLPLVGSLPFLESDLHCYFAKLAHTYGPIMKLKLGSKLWIVLSSPSLAKEVLKDKDTIFSNRDVTPTSFVTSYGCSDIAWAPYGPHWRMVRKVCLRGMLCNKSLDACYDIRRRETRRMVKDIYSKVGMQINIAEQMFLNTLNVIMSMLWGSTIESEERTSDLLEFRQVVGEMIEVLGMSNISDYFPILARFDIQGMEGRMKNLVSWLDRVFDTVIDQRLKMNKAREEGEKNMKEHKDFLQLLLELEEGDPNKPIIKPLLLDMLVAGTDTTSTTVEWAMAEIMKDPKIMRRAQDELDEIVGKDTMVEESDLSKLHYLNALVKEVLRLHPVAPLLIPRRPSRSCIVGGYTVPEGARVMVNAWAIHRDPTIWDTPLEFKPERFLSETSNLDYKGNDFRYIPFGSGRRICVGVLMAERTVSHALATLLHSFDWRFPEGTMHDDLSEIFGLVMKKAKPVVAIPTPRLSNPDLYA